MWLQQLSTSSACLYLLVLHRDLTHNFIIAGTSVTLHPLQSLASPVAQAACQIIDPKLGIPIIPDNNKLV